MKNMLLVVLTDLHQVGGAAHLRRGPGYPHPRLPHHHWQVAARPLQAADARRHRGSLPAARVLPGDHFF